MALLSSTPATRMVPVAGRQFAERRLIRGVGAAERSVGRAWDVLTSRQREYYGSQKNFAGGMQRESTRRQEQKEAAQEQSDRDQGRQDAMQDAPPPAPVTNHAQSVIAPPSNAAIKKEVDDDMYPEGKPHRPAADLDDAIQQGRVTDGTRRTGQMDQRPMDAPFRSSPKPRQRPRPGPAQGSESDWNHRLYTKRVQGILRNSASR